MTALSLPDKVLPALEDKKMQYGISGVSLGFINAYYENRSQHVCYDAVKSLIRSQELGVIQGWTIGPLFFDICSHSFTQMCFND